MSVSGLSPVLTCVGLQFVFLSFPDHSDLIFGEIYCANIYTFRSNIEQTNDIFIIFLSTDFI